MDRIRRNERMTAMIKLLSGTPIGDPQQDLYAEQFL